MAPQAGDGGRRLEFTREEAWVVHAALLHGVRSAVEAGDTDDGYTELDALTTLERNREEFAPDEVRSIRTALESYLAAAPPRDLVPGRTALRRTDGTVTI